MTKFTALLVINFVTPQAAAELEFFVELFCCFVQVCGISNLTNL